jgi:hypothetical protein
VELHHQVLPRLAGEALLLGQGAIPYRGRSVPYAFDAVNTRFHCVVGGTGVLTAIRGASMAR